MLTEHVIECARRKERLIARAQRQRSEIAAGLRRWEQPMSVIERGISIARYLKAHPVLVVVAVAAAAVLGRRNFTRWIGSGLVAWRAWRSMRGWMRRFNV